VLANEKEVIRLRKSDYGSKGWTMIFTDRRDAGFRLADRLRSHPDILELHHESLLVLSIPRGGVVIGAIVASVLDCAHDVLIVKKIGFPGHEELAMGAIAEDGVMLLNREMVSLYSLTPDEVQAAVTTARNKVEHYVRMLRHGKQLDPAGKTVILVDDGAATGETIKAALRWLREKGHRAKKVIVALPVGSPSTMAELQVLADQTICLHEPEDFQAVGQYYWNFQSVSDEEVLAIIKAEETTPN
jgi:predicted phosphoribosyltransferase